MGQPEELSGRGWSPWTPLAGIGPISPEVLGEILDGGQSFRWQRQTDGAWLGFWSDCIVRLQADATGRLSWSAPTALTKRVMNALPTYLALSTNYAGQTDGLPWRSDAHLAGCIAAFPGLRLLRQPFGETLLGFLCSATKQIVQIKQMVALLASRHGRLICELPLANGRRTAVCRLPTWDELAVIPEADLRACLLGFRARYISETARFLAAHPAWLAETEALPYLEAKTRLISLPGVGEKVADCVLLFGAGRLEAFPVDVWILKTMERRYGLEGWSPANLTRFGQVHFGSAAGLAQQYLFAWERRFAPRTRTREK